MRLYTPDGKKCNICGERIRQWRTSHGLTQEELAIKMQHRRRPLARFLRSAPPLISARSPFVRFPSPASGSRLSIFHILLHRV